MTTPIETLMAGVEWELEPPQEPGDLPHITHSGVLELFGKKLRCYRLSNGRAVFHGDDFEKMFCGAHLSERRTSEQALIFPPH